MPTDTLASPAMLPFAQKAKPAAFTDD